MGRLGGLKYRDVARKLRMLGFELERQGKGSHEQWRQTATGKKAIVPRHSDDVREGTLRSILRTAGIDVEDFLKA